MRACLPWHRQASRCRDVDDLSSPQRMQEMVTREYIEACNIGNSLLERVKIAQFLFV